MSNQSLEKTDTEKRQEELERIRADFSAKTTEELLATNAYYGAKFSKVLFERISADSNKKLAEYLENDADAKKPDTAEKLLQILDAYDGYIKYINGAPAIDVELLFDCVFNLSKDVHRICATLQASLFAELTTPYILATTCLLRKCKALQKPKYVEWSLKLYIEALRCLEREEQLDRALALAEELHEEFQASRAALSGAYDAAVEETYRAYDLQLLTLVYKYRLRAGREQFTQWRDKLAGEMRTKKHLLLACMEVLKEERKEPMGLYESKRSAEAVKRSEWKVNLTKHVYELVREDMDKLVECLQLRESGAPDMPLDADKPKPGGKTAVKPPVKGKEAPGKPADATPHAAPLHKCMLDKLSDTFSFSMQADLMRHCYALGLFAEFSALTRTALKRSALYRFERPFIVDLRFVTSTLPSSTPPDGYTLIDVNLNEPYLKEEIKRVRNVARERIGDMRETGDSEDDRASYVMRGGETCSYRELKATDHKFVYLAYRQSYEADDAIIDINVCVADEDGGPKQKQYEGYEKIAIPLNQYRGVKAIYSTIPFLCIKRNAKAGKPAGGELGVGPKTLNQLSKDTPFYSVSTQSVSAAKDKNPLFSSKLLKYGYITQVAALIDHFAYVRPSFEFVKVDVDLRQVPREFIKVRGLDYVYLAYRRESDYFLSYRIVELLRALEELENRDKQPAAVSTPADLVRCQLALHFDETLFLNVVRELKRTANALTKFAAFGDSIFDEFYAINFHIWEKYILAYCQQIEHHYYRRLWGDVPGDVAFHYSKELTDKKTSTVVNYLRVLIKALRLCRFDVDLLFYGKVVCQAAKLLEIAEKDEEASQLLWEAHELIDGYRGQLQGTYIDKRKEFLLPLCLTTDNNAIADIFAAMSERYAKWKVGVEHALIAQHRPRVEQDALSTHELSYENEKFKAAYLKSSRPAADFAARHLKARHHSEYELLIYAVQTEILCAFSRCYIKCHQSSSVVSDAKASHGARSSKLVVPNMTFLLTYKNTKSSKAAVQNQNTLKSNLQEAKYIEPDPLKFTPVEKGLLRLAGKNKYMQAIFVSTLALNRETIAEQTQCLQKAMEIIGRIKAYQGELVRHVTSRAEHYFCYALRGHLQQQVAEGGEAGLDEQARQHLRIEQFYQSQINNKQLEPEAKNPPMPLLLKTSSTSLTFKLLDYRPLISFKVQMENPEKQHANSLVLYGRQIKGENSVGINSTECDNTGVRFAPNAIVEVKKLERNRVYRFCCAGYDANGEIINKPSEPTMELTTAFPLSVHALHFHVGKSAFYLRNFEAAKAALAETLAMGLTRAAAKPHDSDAARYASDYVINKDACLRYSAIELQNLGEAIHMYVLCDFFLFKKKHKYDKRKTIAHTQRFLLGLTDLLVLGCQISSFCRDHGGVVRGLLAAYNLCENFMRKRHVTKPLLSLLVKMHALLSCVPGEYHTDTSLD